MRIRKKTPKPSAKRPPLYFVGYRGAAPATEELKLWYEREYGGPLSVRHEEGSPESWQATHGPWSAHVVMPLPMTHVADVMKQLAWEHERMGAVAPSLAAPRDMPDTVLFAARVARGLTLLTQGTAYDVTTQAYVNPSDWKDRPMTAFMADDHMTVTHDDSARPDHVWSYSLGLTKFGLDEIEVFQRKGLPESTAKELLVESATELLRMGQSPKVGSAFHLPLLGRTVRVVNYRTAAPAGRMLGFRELQG
ncbi:hypothetical protein [Nitrospira moscoviensis]|uniref:DUF4261 domain-containing protein n=1 Tax=Nitrospira moscoviensis TaxID=42253 RepID=A0A0K2GIA8_NITMO|nr:hypothetical protein [Nitrospira moscoviensis]ALA60703.1 hypothetical protein NITMOv2_4327 [Nitrospira moscoviensis]